MIDYNDKLLSNLLNSLSVVKSPSLSLSLSLSLKLFDKKFNGVLLFLISPFDNFSSNKFSIFPLLSKLLFKLLPKSLLKFPSKLFALPNLLLSLKLLLKLSLVLVNGLEKVTLGGFSRFSFFFLF